MSYNPLDFNNDGKTQFMEYNYAMGEYSGDEGKGNANGQGCGGAAISLIACAIVLPMLAAVVGAS